jgi:hypothetical protein
MTSAADSLPRASSGGAGTVIRRIILFTLLFTLVVIAAIGLSGLVERIIGANEVIATDGAGLARALTFTLIGVPLAAVLWWWQRRRLAADPSERASLWWALYLAAMYTVSLIVATSSVARVASAGIDGEWRPGELSAAIVWAGVWLWHRSMRRSTATAPTRLADLAIELAALYGLAVAASGAIACLGALISEALFGQQVVASQQWLLPVLQALVWCAMGVLVWWWHWFREGAETAPGVFATVLLVIVIGAAAATTLFSLGTVLFSLLRVLLTTDSPTDALASLDTAIAAALIGGLVWVYHARVIATRSGPTRRAGRLVVSAIALIGAASGFGVIVNALLAVLSPTLIDDDPRTLLLGGVSALVVGAPAWWLAWRPDRRTPEDAADPARRVYLVAVFGASAVVGLVTLLIIGYFTFESLLDGRAGGGLIERIRVPLGLLSATAIVFAYHFAVWRRDRATAPKGQRRAIGRLILVTAGESAEQVARLRSATGAPVTVWTAADPAARMDEEDLPALLESLTTVSAPRVIVVARPGGEAQVVPLAD